MNPSRNFTALLALLLSCTWISAASGETPEVLVVKKKGFDCLVDKIGEIKIPDKTVSIDIETCPVKKTSQFQFKKAVKFKTGIPVEQILDLDKIELACIRKNKNNIRKYATPFMKKSEKTNKIESYYYIDLKTCTAPSAPPSK
jgi:hypothetical protein